MAVTFTALGMTITKLSGALFTTGLDMGNTLQLIFAILLLILGVLVAIQGELRKAKSIAISLAQEGESVERIARILGETEKTIKEWMAETH